MVLSAIVAGAGEIFRWAVPFYGRGFRLSTVGLIPMIAGAFGFVVRGIIFPISTGPGRSVTHSMSRGAVDSQGHSCLVREESR